jgi:hypothetical protein
LCHSVPSPPMLFSNANPMVYFLSLRRVSPGRTNRLKAVR